MPLYHVLSTYIPIYCTAGPARLERPLLQPALHAPHCCIELYVQLSYIRSLPHGRQQPHHVRCTRHISLQLLQTTQHTLTHSDTPMEAVSCTS